MFNNLGFVIVDKNTHQVDHGRIIKQLLGQGNDTRKIQRDNAVLGVRKMLVAESFYFVEAFRFGRFLDGVVQILEIGNGIIADGCTGPFFFIKHILDRFDQRLGHGNFSCKRRFYTVYRLYTSVSSNLILSNTSFILVLSSLTLI